MVTSKLFFRQLITFLKANTIYYNLTKFSLKKRYYLRDMYAQCFPIKFERQSTSLHFTVHCSWFTNAINKCNDFLEANKKSYTSSKFQPKKIHIFRRGTKSLLFFLGSNIPLLTQTLIESSEITAKRSAIHQCITLLIFIFMPFSNNI